MGLKFIKKDSDKPYRVAVVVSKKVSKSAVTRNRIRRRVYESVRNTQNINPGTDIIITIFSDQVKDMPAKKLNNIVKDLVEKT